MTDSGPFTEDAFLGGQLRLRQPKSGHRAGHDAMLLAAATPARAGDRVVDFGAGVGAAGLAVARRIWPAAMPRRTGSWPMSWCWT
jgi:tRNA1(Val) A37 N6-methylase TrmN6